MLALDMITVLLGNGVVNAVCFVVLLQLWHQNRNKYSGLSLWAASAAMQLMGGALIALRDIIPDWASIVLGNTIIMASLVILCFGLLRFTGRRVSHGPTLTVLMFSAVYVFLQSYFTFVHNDLAARNFVFTAGLCFGCITGLWIMFTASDMELRSIIRGTEISFGLIVTVCLFRMIGLSIMPDRSNDYLRSGPIDTIAVALLAGGMAFLVFNLVLMVNRRLLVEANTLRGLIPICAWCKKVRNDTGYWQSVEAYVSSHSEATFTHGICPDCLKRIATRRQEPVS